MSLSNTDADKLAAVAPPPLGPAVWSFVCYLCNAPPELRFISGDIKEQVGAFLSDHTHNAPPDVILGVVMDRVSGASVRVRFPRRVRLATPSGHLRDIKTWASLEATTLGYLN